VTSRTEPAAPRLRADAARNRARLVATAQTAFHEADDAGSVTMEAVAKRAGVGIGTLYRHFPTRLELMEAVYREDVDDLAERAHGLAETESAWDALAEWLRLFIAFAAAKRAIFSELVDAIGKDSALITHSRAVLNDTVTELLVAAQEDGAARSDVTPADVLSIVGGCSMMHLAEDQAQRVLAVILDGLRA
jgi:AcrR family transcriptional regulator